MKSQIDTDFILNSDTLLDNILTLDKHRADYNLTGILETIIQRMNGLDENDRIDFRRWLEHVLIASAKGCTPEEIEQLLVTLRKGDEQMVHGLQLRILEEFDKGREAGIEAGMKAGMKAGELKKLIQQTCRKLQKGKTALQIADELEEEFSVIEKICDAAQEFAPDFDSDKIFEKIKEDSISEDNFISRE